MNLDKLPTNAGLAYPKLTKSLPNKEYVSILKNLYAGASGETTAIFQYLFQHYIFDPFEPEIADILLTIAKSEMHHQALLGEAIVTFGGTPNFVSGCNEYWTTRAVNYTKNLTDSLMLDIKDEENAIEDYLASAKLIKDVQLSSLLIRIAEDELIHKNTLEYILMHLDSNKKDINY